MTKVVLDTNVLASGFVRFELAPGQILLAWLAGIFELIVSEQILAELARTFEQPYFSKRLSSAQRQANIDLLRAMATITAVSAGVSGIATHPEDDRILAAVLDAEADYLVTGDRKLQALGKFHQTAILSPRQFLEILASGHDNRI